MNSPSQSSVLWCTHFSSHTFQGGFALWVFVGEPGCSPSPWAWGLPTSYSTPALLGSALTITTPSPLPPVGPRPPLRTHGTQLLGPPHQSPADTWTPHSSSPPGPLQDEHPRFLSHTPEPVTDSFFTLQRIISPSASLRAQNPMPRAHMCHAQHLLHSAPLL